MFELVWAGIKGNWGVIIGIALPFIIPNKWIYNVSFSLGKLLSHMLRQKVGKDGEAKIESWLGGTVGSFSTGLTDGMRQEE